MENNYQQSHQCEELICNGSYVYILLLAQKLLMVNCM